MNRAPQLAIIISAGLLLFVASQWPRFAIPACIAMFVVIGISLRFLRPALAGAPAKRSTKRRIVGWVIAIALLTGALILLRQA